MTRTHESSRCSLRPLSRRTILLDTSCSIERATPSTNLAVSGPGPAVSDGGCAGPGAGRQGKSCGQARHRMIVAPHPLPGPSHDSSSANPPLPPSQCPTAESADRSFPRAFGRFTRGSEDASIAAQKHACAFGAANGGRNSQRIPAGVSGHHASARGNRVSRRPRWDRSFPRPEWMAAWEPLVLAAFGRFTRGSDETAASLAALTKRPASVAGLNV